MYIYICMYANSICIHIYVNVIGIGLFCRKHSIDHQRHGWQRRCHRDIDSFISSSRTQRQPRQQWWSDGSSRCRQERLHRLRHPAGHRRQGERLSHGPRDGADGRTAGKRTGMQSRRRHALLRRRRKYRRRKRLRRWKRRFLDGKGSLVVDSVQ